MADDFFPAGLTSGSNFVLPGAGYEDFVPAGTVAPPPVEEEDDKPGLIGEVARGVATAPVELARGLVELGALGVDAAFDTDYLDDVSGAFDSVEEAIGAPTTAAGNITRDLLVFGGGFIPIAGWLGRAGSVARGGKNLNNASRFMRAAEDFGRSSPGRALLGNRAKVLATTALAGGAYEAIVSSGNRATLSDDIQFLPDALKTEQDTGLTGREEAARQFRNRLRQGAEATALGAAFDSLLLGFGPGARALGTLPGVGDALSKTAQASLKGWEALGSVASRVPGADVAQRQARRLFSPGGGLEASIRANINEVKGKSVSEKNEIVSVLTRFNKISEKVVKTSAKRAGRTDLMRQMESDILKYYDAPVGRPIADKYGEELQNVVDELIDIDGQLVDALIRNLEDIIAEAPAVSGKTGIPENMIDRGAQKERAKAVLDIVKANRAAGKNHLSRMYQLYTDPAALYKSLGGKDLVSSPQFRAAEDALVRAARIKTGVMGAGPDAFDEAIARTSARRTLLDTLNLKPLGDDMSPEAIQRAINGRLKQIKDDVLGTGRGLLAQDTPVFKLQQGLLEERRKITEIAPVRALLGEITTPKERLGYMLDNLVTLNTSLRFYEQQARTAVPAVSVLQNITSGQRPSYVYLPGSRSSIRVEDEINDLTTFMRSSNAQQAIDDAKELLRREGYVQLGDENLDDIAGGRFGALSGMFVPQELYDSLTAPLQLGLNPISQFGAILNQMKGLTQKMTIVPNPASRVRDIIGNKLMTIASGNMSSGFGLTDGDAFLTVFRGIRNLDQDGTEALARKLDFAGFTDSSVLLNTLRNIQSEGPEFGAPQFVRRQIEKLETKTPIMAPMLKFFEETTQGADALAKARVLLSEEQKMREAVGAVANSVDDEKAIFGWLERNGIVDRPQSELSMVRDIGSVGKRGAAKPSLDRFEAVGVERTRKFMPTYDEIGLLVRETDRLLPLGNFTSFASENIRNMANILEQGIKELAATADDDLIEALGSREAAERMAKLIRAQGAQRLTGLLTVSAIVPKAIVRAGQQSTGMTDEQMDRLHEQADFFQKGQDIVPLEFGNDGTVKYINLSYTAPYSFVTDAAQAALRGYQERGRLNQSEVAQLSGGAFDFIEALIDPFASESMFVERVLDVLPSQGRVAIGRGGVTQTGARIYNPSDAMGTKVSQGLAHVFDAVIPAVLKLGVTGQKGDETGTGLPFSEGRLTRAMMGVPGARGQEFNVAEEIGRQITGFTPMEVNLKRDFEFAGKSYAPLRSDAKQTANRVIRAADSSEAEILGSWSNYLDSLYRSQSILYNEIQSARELGLSDQDIRRELIQDANLGRSEVNAIMRGEFAPGTVSQEIREEVIRQVNVEERPRLVQNVPWATLNQLSNSRRGELLNPELYRRRFEDTSEPAPAAAPQMGAGEDFIPPGLFAAAPAAPAAPAPAAPAPAARQAPPAELLGGNLMDRLRNSEIVQRLQGE